MKKTLTPDWLTWDGLVSWATRHIGIRSKDTVISILTMWLEQNLITWRVIHDEPRYFLPDYIRA